MKKLLISIVAALMAAPRLLSIRVAVLNSTKKVCIMVSVSEERSLLLVVMFL